MNSKTLIKTTILVTIIMIFEKLSGFFRELALAYAYGTGKEADAMIVSLSIISIFSIVTSAMALGFMPIYKEFDIKNEMTRRNSFLNNVYTVVFILLLFIVLLSIVFTESIVKLIAPGFSYDTMQLSVILLHKLLFMIPFSYVVTIASQQLRAENRFLLPEYIIVFSNLIIIAGYLIIAPWAGVQSIPLIYWISTIVQLLIIKKALGAFGYKYRAEFNITNSHMKKLLILTFPILMGNAIQSVNSIVDKIVASGLGEGAVASLSYANKLNMLVISIISFGIGNVCYSRMSELGAQKHYKELKNFLMAMMKIIVIITIPSTVGFVILNKPIVIFLFEHGAFNENSSHMTSVALIFYSMGLVGYTLRDVISRAYFACQDTKTPMINGALAVLINVVLNLILSQIYGIAGVALATSISAIFGTLFLCFCLKKTLGSFIWRELFDTVIKVSITAGIMGGCVQFIYSMVKRVTLSMSISLVLSIAMGIVIYGVLIFIFKVEEITYIKKLFMKTNTNE